MPRPTAALSQSALSRADRLRDEGSFAAAARAYTEAHLGEPHRADILVQRGNMLKDSGNLAGAVESYRQALERADEADTHLQLGHVLKLAGNRIAAIDCYRRALALDPDLSGAAFELAETGDPDQQTRLFLSGLRNGSMDALLAISQTLATMQAELTRLGRLLPAAAAAAAFPIALYDQYRSLFPVPPPLPPARGWAVTVILLAERESIAGLFSQLHTIQAQHHTDWQLRVVGHDPDRRRVVDLAATADPRIAWVDADVHAGWASAECRTGQSASTGWVMLLAQGARLDPNALGWFAAAARDSAASAFVCDEEVAVRADGRLHRSEPSLRTTVDYDSLLEANVSGETLAVLSSVFGVQAPTLPTSSVAAARTTLLLNLAVDAQVGHIPLPLVWRDAGFRPDAEGHQLGAAAHLAARTGAQAVGFSPDALPLWHPTRPDDAITAIIVTRDNAADVRIMVDSLRKTAARPDALAVVVVDNGSRRLEDLGILESLAVEPGTQVLRQDVAFNWSHLNNVAAAAADAPLLVFANDDMRMVSLDWDERLRGLLEREDVGAVGARLLFEDDTIQHAGVLMNWKGSMIHDGLHEPARAAGPGGRWQRTRCASAVTGAFLATTRRRFHDLGGFDSQNLPVAYSDIDYGLRLRAMGLKIIWTPAITLYHHESRTRGLDHADPWKAARNDREQTAMRERWGEALLREPGISPLWQSYTTPFRLIAAPSDQVLRDHIIRSGSGNAWRVDPPRTEHRP